MSQHTLIREQLVRWTLGEPPDIPVTALLDHLCACSACRSFARSIEETLAALPEALPLERPPQHLRHAVLQTIRNESPQDAGPQAVAEEADHEDAAEAEDAPRAAGTRLRRRLQGALQPVLAGVLLVVLALAVSTIGLMRNLITIQRELMDVTARYEADTRWLEAASLILVEELPPVVRLPLTPTGYETGAAGQAVQYRVYGSTHYLLVSVKGLAPGAEYEVWLQTDGGDLHLGTLTTSQEGGDVWVYRSLEGAVTGRLVVRRSEAPEPSVMVDL